MRAAGLVAWAIVLLLAAPSPAHASAGVPGGRYVERIHDDGAKGRIGLTLANDGLEFAVPSFAQFRVGRCHFSAGLAGATFGLGAAAVAVDGEGRFRHAEASSGVRGRFIRGGRVAVGRVTAPDGFGCRHVSVRFRARLRGTPNAARPGFPSSCDVVTFEAFSAFDLRGEDGYEPSEQGIGCTTARRLARQWHRSPECRALNTPGMACSLGAATCETIPLGTWRPLARIRCSTPERPGGATELVYLRACMGPNARGFSLKAINLDCRTARTFPFAQTLETDGPCGNVKRVAFGHPVTCAPFAGYACTVYVEIKGIAFYARCVEAQTRSVGLVLYYDDPG